MIKKNPVRSTKLGITWWFIFCLFFSTPLFAFDPYTNRELDALTQQFATAIYQSPQVLKEPLADDYINRLGQRLTDAIGMVPATFFIVNATDLNAFAGPGGYIGLNTALLFETQNEDELAAVMAHELAHVHLHHLYDMIEHQKQLTLPTMASLLAAMALGTIDPNLLSGALAATLTVHTQHAINYTRAHERDADRIGITMLKRAGFNPYGMASFFKKMQQQTRYYDFDHIPAILRSHPLDPERIAEVENRLPPHTPRTFQEKETYHLFKAFLRSKVAMTMKPLIEYYEKNFPNPTPVQQYGLALAYLENHHFLEAKQHLTPLYNTFKNEPFYIITLAQTEVGLHHPQIALQHLETLYHTHPNHLPTILTLAQVMIQDQQYIPARLLLIKTFRRYPQHLTLCKTLAYAEAQAQRLGYAYFTEATCDIIQHHPQNAIQRLKTAKQYAQHDTYLMARIDAKLNTLKEE